MKFVSKQSNLRVVLRPGMPREPLSGRSAVPGLYVKFEDGIANVTADNMIEMMREHPGYQRDFIVLEDNESDPYKNNRKQQEPEHNIMEVDYGHVGKNINPKQTITFSPDQKKMVDELVRKAVSEAAIPLATEMVKEIIAKSKEKAEEEAIKSEPNNTPDTENKDISKTKTTGKAAK